MSNLDLFFQKPTAPAPSATRPSSAGAPARKSGASQASRGGRAFDDVMSRVSDDASRDSAAAANAASREPARTNGGAREQAPAVRDKKASEPAASDQAAANGSTSAAHTAPASNPAIAGDPPRAQGSAHESSKKDPQDATDGEPRGAAGESSAGATQAPNALAAAQATAGATAWLLASVPASAYARAFNSDTLTQGGDASAIAASAAAGVPSGSATDAPAAPTAPTAATQAASDAAATAHLNQATASDAASSGLSAELAALAAKPTDANAASQAALADAAAKAVAAAAAAASSKPAGQTPTADIETLVVQGQSSTPPTKAAGESIDVETQVESLVNLPGSDAGSGAKATLSARVNGAGALPLDAARQRAATELQSALARAAGQPTPHAPAHVDAAQANVNSAAAANGQAGATSVAMSAASGPTLFADNIAAAAAAGSDARAERQAANGTSDSANLVTAAAQAAAEEASAQADGQGPSSGDESFARGSASGNGNAGGSGSASGGAHTFTLGAPASTESSATLGASSTSAVDPRGFGVAAPADRVGGTFAGPAAGERLTGGSQVSEADSQQIIRTMRLQWRGPVGEAQLVLRPEHLGQVTVTVRVDHGAVSATLRAETAAAQQWMQAHQQDLRQALQQQGLDVAEVVITTNPDGQQRQQQARDQQGASRQRQPRAGADANQPRFEIRV